jgi:hypothetical protein
MNLGVICEGHGEVAAVPILVRRIAERMEFPTPNVMPPHRVRRSKLVKPSELERVVELVARKAGPGAPILVLLDADDDCPAQLGPALLRRARQQRSDREIAVVLACREFEAWFLTAARSLAGRRGLPELFASPLHAEAVKGAKEWLDRNMLRGYSEALDQPAFAALMSLEEADLAPSFGKLVRDTSRLLASAAPSHG